MKLPVDGTRPASHHSGPCLCSRWRRPRKCNTWGQEVAEGLAGAALEGDVDGVVGQAHSAKPTCQLKAQCATDGPVYVVNWHPGCDWSTVLQCRSGLRHKLLVKDVSQLMVL